MRKIFIKVLTLAVVLLGLGACKKDEQKSILNPKGEIELKASTDQLVLEKSMEEQEVISFTFNQLDFGYNAAVINVLQFSEKSDNFSKPLEVTLSAKELKKAFNGLEFNQILLKLNLPEDEFSDIEVRLMSYVGNKLGLTYSNKVSLNVKPYPLVFRVYVPGHYQKGADNPTGWTPETADSLISATGNGIYEGVIYFPNANTTDDDAFEFKITTKKDWENGIYGDLGNGKTELGKGNNFKVPGAGSYKITLNTNDDTYKIEKFSWGVVGSANPTSDGWNVDSDMRYNNTTGLWEINITFLTGDFKFRYNHDWGINLGADPDGEIGDLKDSGADIPITAGNYNIVLDVGNKSYTIVKK
ncbi:SusE domain-containing protein [Pseudopedobacter beijingensis]|uniref:SusE domain-containing protein n=1 Tax=Pseudopedobacter beijingensis TaxID=1207056 RepID=A0ABW4I7H5_9SPHI